MQNLTTYRIAPKIRFYTKSGIASFVAIEIQAENDHAAVTTARATGLTLRGDMLNYTVKAI